MDQPAARRPDQRSTAHPAPTRPIEVFTSDTPGTTLHTQRLLLRPPVPADADAYERAIIALTDSGDVSSGVSLPGEGARTIVKRQLDMAAKGLRTGNALRRAIFDRTDAQAILGCCNLITIERGLEWYAELAFWLTPSARGKGMAREACEAVVQHALADLPGGLGVTSVRAYVQPDNRPAQSVLDAVGFTHKPAVREHKPTGGEHRPYELWIRGIDA